MERARRDADRRHAAGESARGAGDRGAGDGGAGDRGDRSRGSRHGRAPKRRAFGFSRRVLVLASVALGLFVLADLALFGWLIFRSLSQREVEEVLIAAREQALEIADELEGRARQEGADLYTAVASEVETLTYVDETLDQRELVYTVEVYDREGILVFRSHTDARIFDPAARRGSLDVGVPGLRGEGGAAGPPAAPPAGEPAGERDPTPEVQVPIGDLGTLHIGLSQGALEERIEVLRQDLIGKTATVGALTVAMLFLAYAAVWWLWRRGRRLEAQAAEAERLAYLGTLASGLAHEIRNPLNSLSLNMQLLEEELPTGREPTHRRLLSITREEIGRLERLVTDFLSYARPRKLEREEVPAARLLARSRDVLWPAIRSHGARVTLEVEPEGLALSVDPERMTQLLINLLQNALAATEGRHEPEILLAARRLDEGTVLVVRDDGTGIPESERERVFDIFYSTRRGGTGLGLAVVDTIARAHGGRVELDSREGRGTEVRVLLPAEAVVEGRADEVERALGERRATALPEAR